MEKEILRLYQERIDKYDQVFHQVSEELDRLKVTQRELTELRWDNNRLSSEITDLRGDIAGLNASLVKERQDHLEVVADNDRLRVREHELERRVRVLANVSARYYANQHDAAVRGSDGYGAALRSASETTGSDATRRPLKRQRNRDSLYMDGNDDYDGVEDGGDDGDGDGDDDDSLTKDQYDRKQLEIDNETLQLSIETMRIQIGEQKSNYKEIIEGLNTEFKEYRAATAKESADKLRRIEALEAELAKIKGLYRENLRDLIVSRKEAQASKHSSKQESLLLRSEILTLQRRLDVEMERARFLRSITPSSENTRLPAE
ncbi:hypothetical protein GGH99_002287 [Coemansia sp. RSA 1285]|nr:hypothetical protein EV177_005683 [Coemansia sp. RSA 1804]KAJ2691617.1 hypothetical protein GGH99_002287 [Coemansia sp. RSA 1285]